MGGDAVAKGRRAFEQRAWRDAYDHLSGTTLDDPDDVDLLGQTAYLIGEDASSDEAFARAYQLHLDAGRSTAAARSAFWLAWGLMVRGRGAQAGAWYGRAQRLVDEHGDCAEAGYLLVPQALGKLAGEPDGALASFGDALAMGEQHAERDLAAFGMLGRGQALIRLGRVEDGLASLDEVMVAVTADEVSARLAGTVYCAVLLECSYVFDIDRAREWTEALSAWCDAQPDLVPFRGQCLVHRSEVLQRRGRWTDAEAEADRARERLIDPPTPALGLAWYQLGELHRLRGRAAEAEEAYRQANRSGRQPQPGLALLRLDQGQPAVAEASIRRSLEETTDPTVRPQVLTGAIDILLGIGDLSGARACADELLELAATIDAAMLRASAARADGATSLAEGKPDRALEQLRRALEGWLDLEVPYEAARVRALIGSACAQLGDEDTARLELDAARAAFEELGATPDLARLDPATKTPGDLTRREVGVLTLVAAGKTNREIGRELSISEKTVERHLSNIFTKIDVSSRAAATAYAYEHDLI